jgi:uncharacterized membrane protein
MAEITESVGFIVLVLVASLLLSVFSEKMLFYVLVLVLLGMVILNSNKISKLIKEAQYNE